MFQELHRSGAFVEIQKGTFLSLIPGTECRGYHTEIGTNILSPKEIIISNGLRQAAAESAARNVDCEIQRGTRVGKAAAESEVFRQRAEFKEFVQGLTYGTCNQLQAPVYNNGAFLTV